MTRVAGSRLGPYEILSPLGSGGMEQRRRWLYVVRPHEPQRKHVYRVELATGHRELWNEVAPDDPAGVIEIGNLSVTSDGRAYGYQVVRAITSDLYIVEGLK